MTLDPILAAGLGGFLAWALGRTVTIIVVRQRLITYLKTVLNVHFRSMKENQTWLKQLMMLSIVAGKTVDGAPIYSRDELSDISAARLRCLELLTKSELTRLTKCFNYLWECEALFDGFCASLRERQEKSIPLDEDDVEFFHLRALRINSYIDRMPSSIDSLNELPEDYAGVIGAITLVINGSKSHQPSKSGNE